MKRCALCMFPAKLFCESDEANLCNDCDSKVHSANFLVERHIRYLLCNTCQSPTRWKASGAKLGHTISDCDTCVEIYGGGESDEIDGEDDGDDQIDGVDDNQVMPSPPPPDDDTSSSSGEDDLDTEILKRGRDDSIEDRQSPLRESYDLNRSSSQQSRTCVDSSVATTQSRKRFYIRDISSGDNVSKSSQETKAVGSVEKILAVRSEVSKISTNLPRAST